MNMMTVVPSFDCLPTDIELFGVVMYYDKAGILRTSDFLLLNATEIRWDSYHHLHFQLLAPKTSFHAFRLRVRSGEEGAVSL